MDFEQEPQVGNALAAEFAPGTNFNPPASQEEFQQRKQGWAAALEQINSDPNMRMMILRMGLQMMQPKPTWQTTGGHIANAVEGSLDWLGAQQEMQRKAGLEERKTKLDERKGEADITHTGAVTKNVEQTVSQGEQIFPSKLKAAESTARKLNIEEQTLKAQEAAGMFTPEYFTRKRRLEEAKARLDNEYRAALTEQALAHAGAYNSIAGKGTTGKPTVQKVTFPDGTDGSQVTNMIDGQPWVTYVRPSQMTAAQAVEVVDKEVKKKVGYGILPPDFPKGENEATYRLRRMKELSEPQVQHVGPDGRVAPALPKAAASGADPLGWNKLNTAPSQYDTLFASAEQANGLPSGILKRLAITESSLNEGVKNSKDGGGGSYGLMQINGVHLAGNKLTPETVVDPTTNINLGAKLFKQALDKAGGDVAKAVEIYKGATSSAGKAQIANAQQFIVGEAQPTTPATAPAAANAAPSTGPTKVVRGADGKLSIAGTNPQQPTAQVINSDALTAPAEPGGFNPFAKTPEATVRVAKEEGLGAVMPGALKRAMQKLPEIKAKQEKDLPLTAGEKEALLTIKRLKPDAL